MKETSTKKAFSSRTSIPHANANGYIVVYVLVISAVATAVAAGMIFFNNVLTIGEQVAKITSQHTFKIIGNNFREVLKDDAVAATAADPANGSKFACITTATFCANVWSDFNKVQISPTLTYYDTRVAAQGFTRAGQVCNTYPSSECFLRIIKMEWAPKCPGGCVGDDIKVRLEFEIDDSNSLRSKINVQNYIQIIE